MRRTAIVVVAIAVTSVLPLTAAFATPPTGDIKYTDYARVQAVDGASTPINGRTNLAMGLYSIAPGGETGWRSLPGLMVLTITKGKLTVHGGDGCAAKDYAAGQAAVVPAGTYRVHNAGNEPVDFFGAFLDQPIGGPKPLAEGPTESAPASCNGVTAAAAPGGVSVKAPAAGTIFPTFYSKGATLNIEAGKDVFATHYEIGEGASTGWLSHTPAINIVEQGELGYVEGRDGKCDLSEYYVAGQAFYHPAHRHMAYNKGKGTLVLTTVFFNLPHDAAPPPVVGNQLTAIDFTQAPPADCPRLR
jgi:quercetin dioxygenase-like cupin family protein